MSISSPAPEPSLAIVEGNDAAVTHAEVFSGLRAFNRQHAAPPNRAPLVVAAKGDDGRLVAGLVGETAWGWLFVDLLWVDEAHRRRGLGRRVLRFAESEARLRHCVGSYLDTFDFQARPFYEREGYAVFGTLEDYPVGHRRFFLQKKFIDDGHDMA